jgi:hypothetical protein
MGTLLPTHNAMQQLSCGGAQDLGGGIANATRGHVVLPPDASPGQSCQGDDWGHALSVVGVLRVHCVAENTHRSIKPQLGTCHSEDKCGHSDAIVAGLMGYMVLWMNALIRVYHREGTHIFLLLLAYFC